LFPVCCFRFLFMCIFISYFTVCHCDFCSVLWKKRFYSCFFVQFLFALYVSSCVIYFDSK
jgi:hypothetical protein